MPISAIDTTTVAPRSAEASNLVGKEQQQMQHVGENSAAMVEKQVEQNNQRTIETKQSETEEYDMDGSGSGAYGGNRKKKKKKEEEPKMAPRSNSSFDVTI